MSELINHERAERVHHLGHGLGLRERRSDGDDGLKLEVVHQP